MFYFKLERHYFSVVKQCFVLYPKQWNQLPPCIVLPEAMHCFCFVATGHGKPHLIAVGDIRLQRKCSTGSSIVQLHKRVM